VQKIAKITKNIANKKAHRPEEYYILNIKAQEIKKAPLKALFKYVCII